MKYYIIFAISVLLSNYVLAQRNIIFLSPTNYEGVLNEVVNSARAEALGKNTITINGLRTSFENPATIAPGTDKIQVALNYTKGHPYFPKAYYNFAGISYRLHEKISIGLTTHQWMDPDSYWDAEIASRVYPTSKKSQRVFSLVASGQIAKDLYLGLSGNLLRDMEIKGSTNGKDFILNTGLIYDRSIHLIKAKQIQQEKIRFAASLYNALFDGETIQRANDSVFQYRDMPAIARLGIAHSFSIPIQTSSLKKVKRLKEAPQILEISTRIQYSDYLKARKNFGYENKYQTAIGIGIEATALNLLSARIGYFTESRAPATNTTDLFATKTKRKGFTWGLGCIIPANQWSNGKIPFDFKFDLLANRLPDLLDEKISTLLSDELTDKRLMLSLGIELSFKK